MGPVESWLRHQTETFSALLAICAGNSPVTGEFPAQRPVTRSFDVFFDLRLNERLSKQSRGWWFETQSHPLWRQSNVFSVLMEGCHVHGLFKFVGTVYCTYGQSNTTNIYCGVHMKKGITMRSMACWFILWFCSNWLVMPLWIVQNCMWIETCTLVINFVALLCTRQATEERTVTNPSFSFSLVFNYKNTPQAMFPHSTKVKSTIRQWQRQRNTTPARLNEYSANATVYSPCALYSSEQKGVGMGWVKASDAHPCYQTS